MVKKRLVFFLLKFDCYHALETSANPLLNTYSGNVAIDSLESVSDELKYLLELFMGLFVTCLLCSFFNGNRITFPMLSFYWLLVRYVICKTRSLRLVYNSLFTILYCLCITSFGRFARENKNGIVVFLSGVVADSIPQYNTCLLKYQIYLWYCSWWYSYVIRYNRSFSQCLSYYWF